MKRFMLKGSSTTVSGTEISSASTNITSTKDEKMKSATTATTTEAVKRFYDLLNDPTVVERVRVTLKNAHVFKLPPRKSASGWRGADWREEVWVGTCKVVDRMGQTAVMLLNKTPSTTTSTSSSTNIFAICLALEKGAVDRCIDSSRYFVLRVENSQGDRKYIGLAFNDRNDAFDFNASLEDAKREREVEQNLSPTSSSSSNHHQSTNTTTDYSLKEGQKIHVNISKNKLNPTTADDRFSTSTDDMNLNEDYFDFTTINETTNNLAKAKDNSKDTKAATRGVLAPSTKDTPSSRLNRHPSKPT